MRHEVRSYKERSLERRGVQRQTMVLRVGIIDDGTKTSFCLLKNISADGVQVKTYCPMIPGTSVSISVGDQDSIPGRLVWYRDRLAGVQFSQQLAPDALLRVQQKRSPFRRRASPRAKLAAADATLRTGGRMYRVRLDDISTSGAKVRTSRAVSSEGAALLELSDLPPIKTFIRLIHDHEIGLAFGTPLPIEILAEWVVARTQVNVSC